MALNPFDYVHDEQSSDLGISVQSASFVGDLKFQKITTEHDSNATRKKLIEKSI